MLKLAAAIVFGVTLLSGSAPAQPKGGKAGRIRALTLFGEAFERIRRDAVDPVSDAKLIGSAIAGMLAGLDPHASFMDDAAFKASQTPANDDAGTLGLAVTIQNGQLQVISPEDGSPAARAGIRPGDVIFTIDKEPVYDLALGEVEQKLRGPAGSEVRLVMRHGTEKPLDLTLKREAYKLQTVVGRVEGGNIGYLRIAGFDSGTQAALTAAVRDLRQMLGSKTFGESSIESVIPLGEGGAIPLTTARYTTPSGRRDSGKGSRSDLAVTSLKLARLAQGQMRREADLPGALKNPDQTADKPAPAAPPGAAATPTPDQARAVATRDIGSASDEQLSQAIDLLRGLA